MSLYISLGVVVALSAGASACSSDGGPAGTGSGGQSGSGGLGSGGGGADISGAGGLGDALGGSTGGGSASAGGQGNSGSGGQVVSGTISDLMITANPNNVLSAWVTWTTSEPADSVVQFGKDTLTLEVAHTELVTEHKVLVIGMRAETAYQMRALSTGASGTLEGTGNFTTAALPAQIPVGTVSVPATDKTQPGWTLMNVQKGDGTNRAMSGAPPAAVIYDEEGQPVWYFINGTELERGGAISVDPTDLGITMGPSWALNSGPALPPIEVDWAGDTVWTCADTLCGLSGQLSHHVGKLSNGHYIVMNDASVGSRTSQIFQEFDPASPTPVHSIGVEDLVTPPSSASGDWAHGNSITVDLENDVAYLSFRWLGVIKAKYSTGELL
ncbi:MAG TPA: hypothetical protein VN764_09940, partial [Polyangiaceae bacterium]|nr:hypothetical protein [Polyangiaceae bacterium]